eukprot:scaffold11881_cov149-Skeletonema_menzelii.AAC.10
MEYANQAGLLPELEWQLICRALNEQLSPENVDGALCSEVIQDLSKLELSQQSVKGETQQVIDPFKYLVKTTRIEPDVASATDATSNKKKIKVKKNEHETKSLIPISPNRRGAPEDISVPYSVELWRKSKTLNRDRAVFGCSLAHLIAMKTLIGDDHDKSDDLSSHDAKFDFILEDNVRAFVGLEDTVGNNSCECACRIWDLIEASNKAQDKPHLRYYGWLGSKPNLSWVYNNHIPRKAFGSGGETIKIFPFPTNNDFLLDSIDGTSSKPATNQTTNKDTTEESTKKPSFSTPGGTAVWGMFAYTISPAAYHSLIAQLQNDVGMLMWKGKRMRAFQAKAIDKIIPRTVREVFGEMSVHLSDKVGFVRCPMLGSMLHSQWEEGFCESTELQYALSSHGEGCNAWDNVWLGDIERQIVDYRKKNGKWIRKEDIQGKSPKSKSNGSARSRSLSPVNIVTLSMLLLVNTLAFAFTTSMQTAQRKATLCIPSILKASTEAVRPNSEERQRAKLGHVPIISRSIQIADEMNVTVWEMEKPSEIIQEWWSIDESERTSRVGDPFGVIMWPGSILASRELMKQQQAVSNATVLVLGAGTGVEAQAAALLGAKKVIATDINPLSLQLLAYGASKIETIGPDVVEAKYFDLFSKDPLPKCDILVAADTLYNAELAKQVGHRLHEAITRSFEDGHTPIKVIVTDSQKVFGTNFLEEQEMIALNTIFEEGKWKPLEWKLETLNNFCGSGVLIDDDQIYDVDVRVIRWGWDVK